MATKLIGVVLYSLEILMSMSSGTYCELFSSTEQLSSWPLTSRKLLGAIDENIRLEEGTLPRLRETINTFERFTTRLIQDNFNNLEEETITNPITAYVNLNRIIHNLEEFKYQLDQDFAHAKELIQQAENQYNELKAILPGQDDLVGIVEAIIRLQKFYRLNTSDLSNGRLILDEDDDKRFNNEIRLTAGECFQIGKIAYENRDYNTSVIWFQRSLELISSESSDDYEQVSEEDVDVYINDILDYLAFAAYKIRQVEYAAQVTKLWLKRDPDNDRARENLDYYTDLIEGTEISEHQIGDPDDETEADKIDVAEIYKSNDSLDAGSYILTEDDIVRNLCIGSQAVDRGSFCYVRNIFAQDPSIPDLRIEVLSELPLIMRIHDLITDKEAAQLRQIALHKLERSTVQSTRGLVASDFRIAKTAWLASSNNAIIQRVENRLSLVTGLRLENSEDLQVVNYGLGGYYGPHLDSARHSRRSDDASNDEEEEQVEATSLKKSDRLATILIYLNRVDAGGATVFPRLNLTVKPMKNSAIIWYNLNRDGFSDERTLHSGCPVLLGTKWIATKWPREAPNIFLRPCELRGSL